MIGYRQLVVILLDTKISFVYNNYKNLKYVVVGKIEYAIQNTVIDGLVPISR